MTQKEKQLLLQDLCARLPYGVKILSENYRCITLTYSFLSYILNNGFNLPKPYLRPMSSMTEEEKEELLDRLPKYWSFEIDKLGDLYFDICDASYPDIELLTNIIDWLNVHHFDYRGLIEKGLAIEAPEGMYK